MYMIYLHLYLYREWLFKHFYSQNYWELKLEIWLGNCPHQEERLWSSLEKIGFHQTELWAYQIEYWESNIEYWGFAGAFQMGSQTEQIRITYTNSWLKELLKGTLCSAKGSLVHQALALRYMWANEYHLT